MTPWRTRACLAFGASVGSACFIVFGAERATADDADAMASCLGTRISACEKYQAERSVEIYGELRRLAGSDDLPPNLQAVFDAKLQVVTETTAKCKREAQRLCLAVRCPK